MLQVTLRYSLSDELIQVTLRYSLSDELRREMPLRLCAFFTEHGWVEKKKRRQGIVVFTLTVDEVDVLMDTTFADYERRTSEALQFVSDHYGAQAVLDLLS